MAINKRIEMVKHFLKVLSDKQKDRPKCKNLEWIDQERDVMFNEVNKQRSFLGKDGITLKELMRMEQMAVGHSDYSEKFSRYCAELVIDGPMKGTS